MTLQNIKWAWQRVVKGMIFSETLKLIKAFEEAPQEDYWKHPSTSSRLLEYVGRNIGFYWD